MNDSSNKNRIFFFTTPRSACHLAEKMLTDAQPDLYQTRHFWEFLIIDMGNTIIQKPIDELDSEVEGRARKLHMDGYENMLKALKDTDEKGVKLWYHDHIMFCLNPTLFSNKFYGPTSGKHKEPSSWTVKLPQNDPYHPQSAATNDEARNPTVLPDAFFTNDRHKYIMTIRHPMLEIPSMYRACKDILEIPTSKATFFCFSDYWQRNMYEFLASKNMHPNVIDAGDYDTTDSNGNVIISPALAQVCKNTGLDPEKVVIKWDKMPDKEQEKMNQRQRHMMWDLLNSDGIKVGQRKGEDLKMEVEREKWVKEFSEDAAKIIQEVVESSMEDYTYLYERRIKP